MKDLKVIKLSTPWHHPFFYDQTPGSTGIIGDYRFEIDNDCTECDFWVVWGGLNQGYETAKVRCPEENVIFLTDEVHTDRRFYQKFLDQFPTVITCRTDIEHRNIIHHHELNTWHLKRSFDELYFCDSIEKTKSVCVMSSDLIFLEGHKQRFAFINKLIGHFKDRLDVYGRGLNPFDDKFTTLSPYKYSIAIENSFVPGYFTEKISECYLTHTMPIYFGCPNIHDYFAPASMLNIDLNDYRASIQSIERLLEEDPYDEITELIKQQKKKYLDQYNVFPGLVNLMDKHFSYPSSKSTVKIRREPSFTNFYTLKRIIQIYNNRSIIPEKWKFDINFRNQGNFSKKHK